MTITLPEETMRAVEQRAAAEGYATAEEYVASLIVMDLSDESELGAAISPEDWSRGEADVAAGRCRPAEEAIRDLARAHGIDLGEAGSCSK
jgi:hypothetical protein